MFSGAKIEQTSNCNKRFAIKSYKTLSFFFKQSIFAIIILQKRVIMLAKYFKTTEIKRKMFEKFALRLKMSIFATEKQQKDIVILKKVSLLWKNF